MTATVVIVFVIEAMRKIESVLHGLAGRNVSVTETLVINSPPVLHYQCNGARNSPRSNFGVDGCVDASEALIDKSTGFTNIETECCMCGENDQEEKRKKLRSCFHLITTVLPNSLSIIATGYLTIRADL